jgi:hypothetical protein
MSISENRAKLPQDVLPPPMTPESTEGRMQRPCKSAEQAEFSVVSRPLWRPRIPLSQRAAADLEAAYKLRAVLEDFLRIKNTDRRSQSDFESAGVAAYQRVFGHPVSGRWFRELYRRTVERDNGNEDWSRLEIYLDDKPAAAPAVPLAPLDYSALRDRLAFQNPSEPTLLERQNALEYSFGCFEAQAAASPDHRQEIKRSILSFLFSTAPNLAKSYAALERNWNRRFDQWKKNGMAPSAIADQRPLNSGNFCLDDLETDLNVIVDEAWRHDGKLSIAIRKLRRAGRLSEVFLHRFTLDLRRDKTYVARSVRNEIKARLQGMLAHRRSKWKVNMQGPRIARDHGGYRRWRFARRRAAKAGRQTL